ACDRLGARGSEARIRAGTAAATGWPAGARARLRRDVPLDRIGTPQEVAALAVYLLSDEGGFATGADFALDGGYTARGGHGGLARQDRAGHGGAGRDRR